MEGGFNWCAPWEGEGGGVLVYVPPTKVAPVDFPNSIGAFKLQPQCMKTCLYMQ